MKFLYNFDLSGLSLFISVLLVISIFGIALSLIPSQLTSANFGVDGGDLLAAILTNGIPHPSGYPTYILLGQLFQKLPISTPYYRGALLSAIPASLAAGLSTLWTKYWQKNSAYHGAWSGLVIGLGWGFSQIFLSQAVIVEVYGLHSLFIVLSLIWIMLLFRTKNPQVNQYTLLALSLGYGIGLGNHITLLILMPVIIGATWYAQRKYLPLKLIFGQFLMIFLGLSVYIYLPLQARHYPPVNWGNPQSWSNFFWVVTAKPYHTFLLDLNPIILINKFLPWFELLRKQFGLIGILLGVLGAFRIKEYDYKQSLLLLWMFISYSIFAIMYDTADSIAYLIPSYLAFSLWIGAALYFLADCYWKTIPIGTILGVGMIIYFVARLPQTYRMVNPKQDDSVDQFAQQYLNEVPKGSILFSETDADSFPLWYYHFGLKMRSDISVIVLPLTQFVWYQETLTHTYPRLKLPTITKDDQKSAAWGETIVSLNPTLPVCRSHVDSFQPLELSYSCITP
jgi:hypothetical protein